MNALQIRDLTYVRACCEHWARVWVSRRFGFAEESSTGRLMSGSPGTNCRCRGMKPSCQWCDGTGRISGDLSDDRFVEWVRCQAGCENVELEDGGHEYRLGPAVCFRCGGRGKRIILHRNVNPASIKTTVDVGGKHVGDLTFHLVEKTLKAWLEHGETVWPRKVLRAEYLWTGTQETKCLEMRISTSWYEKNLRQAHLRLEPVLMAG